MATSFIKRFFSGFFRADSSSGRWLVAFGLVAVLVANFFGVFEPVKTFSEAHDLKLKIGTYSIGAFDLLHGIVTIIFVFWIAGFIAAAGERYLRRLTAVDVSNQKILIKAFRVLVFVTAIMMALNAIGLDLTALTLFSGAIGIGLGFGLQKITSNFISGIILLFEKSVTEGDRIELSGGHSGTVKRIGARYTLIETSDSKDIMVPNEDFITNRVTNRTFTDLRGQIVVQLGVSYEADLKLAQTLMTEAAREHPRCSPGSEPVCFLTDYAASAVNFTLYFWIDDLTQGMAGPKSDVLLSIWDKFKTHGIGIPYPQSEIHIKNLDALVESSKTTPMKPRKKTS